MSNHHLTTELCNCEVVLVVRTTPATHVSWQGEVTPKWPGGISTFYQQHHVLQKRFGLLHQSSQNVRHVSVQWTVRTTICRKREAIPKGKFSWLDRFLKIGVPTLALWQVLHTIFHLDRISQLLVHVVAGGRHAWLVRDARKKRSYNQRLPTPK